MHLSNLIDIAHKDTKIFLSVKLLVKNVISLKPAQRSRSFRKDKKLETCTAKQIVP